MLKNRKVILIFSIISFIVFVIQVVKVANYLKINSKINSNDQKNYINFWSSLKVYSNYYFRLPISFTTKNNSVSDFSSDESQQFATINRILFTNKAILGDPNVFADIITDIYKESEIDKIYEQQDQNRFFLMSFLLDIKYLSKFLKDLASFNLKCNIIPTNFKYFDLLIPASIYIKCGQFYYHVSIMYPRGNFYWIPQDDFKIDHMTKSFSDSNRALNKFKTVVIEHKSKYLTVPLDTSHFLYQYKHSKFIECNQQLAESTYKIQKQNVVKTTFFVSRFSYIRDLLESHQKVYWLMAGTLLGWYRECGIIPHTTDADLSLYSDQFDPEIENFLINNKLIPLSLKFGLDNDSLEFRIGHETAFHIDLFFTYELNQTHQWFPYHSGRQVKRTIFSKFSGICSAELNDEKFLVPCDPVRVLNEIYGDNGWQRPDKKFKVSPNLKAWKSWNFNQWLNAIKFYHKGTFLKDKTLNFIRNRLLKDEKMP